MVLTVVNGYVSKNNMYINGFVHAREKEYLENNIDTMVYNLDYKKYKDDYEIEGVKVNVGNSNRLIEIINSNLEIKCICFHFLNPQMLKILKKINRKISVVVFVHGNEALWWYQRLFPDTFCGIKKTLKFFKYIIVNMKSMFYIRNNINKINNINIVCVSNWMKEQTMKNWRIKSDRNIHVIPNVINENIFKYTRKVENQKYNFLMIRQFTNGKYALDIAMDIIKKLETYPEANKFNFTIIGDGWFHEKYTKQIRGFKNIKIYKKFIPQKEIAEYHKENGFFICPTRQDSQGVSMCEAMSSGLIPITSRNTAIPEFLPNDLNLSFTTVEQAVERIIEIVRDDKLFNYLSEECARFIKNKCGIIETTYKEIQLMHTLNKDIDNKVEKGEKKLGEKTV